MPQDLFLPLGIVSVVILFILFFLWGLYNDFISKRNQVRTDFSDIDVQVKRKADLIDKLVTLTQDYATHEKTTFEDVAKARSALNTSRGAHETAQAENMLSDTLKSLILVAEDNPKLKANENYLTLMSDLTATEDKIAQYREEYNKTVQDFNTAIQSFPNLLAAKLFGFAEAELFQA